MKRFVLCRPQGGFNDMLNQIERCYSYALVCSRHLIVDTAYIHSESFRDRFSKYFLSRHPRMLLENPLSAGELDSLEAFPTFVSGRVSSYRVDYDQDRQSYVEADSRQVITFNMRSSYREPLLVHQGHGGGLRSIFCLGHLTLSPMMRTRLEERMRRLPAGYAALHVRNTDMKSDYRPMLAEIRKRAISDLFVATDDRRVIDECRVALSGTAIHSFSDIPDTGGKPIHIGFSTAEAEVRNSDAILDLLILAQARLLFLCRKLNSSGPQISGYARLASLLNENPEYIRDLIGQANV
ncbi:MAG: hypothetical protein IOC86_10360 [Aestuariivirga sp.]|nr:hypothetical protein [Aestuariivirga sp.]